jgi:hypothetical protein
VPFRDPLSSVDGAIQQFSEPVGSAPQFGDTRLQPLLGPLSRHMKTTGSWDALVTVKPLNITGATGSPANATAVT